MTNIPSSTSPMPARNRVAIPIRIPSDGECYRSGWVLVAFENQAAYPQVFGILSGFEGIGAAFHPGIRFEMDVDVDGAFEESISVAHGRSPTGERFLREWHWRHTLSRREVPHAYPPQPVIARSVATWQSR